MKSLAPIALLVAACTSTGIAEQSLTQPVGECGETETHVFGVYKSGGGEVTVRIDRPGNHALVLTGHESVKWRIVTGPGVTIAGVYTVGVDPQTLMNPPAGARLGDDHMSGGGPGGCAYSYPEEKPGCDTAQLLRLVDKTVGHEATSFHGCFAATEFTMGADLATTSDCTEHSDGRAMSQFVTNCNGPDSCGGPIIL
ncbi:MAG: hypothetical protein KF773_32075 [Deltaproteobacteria bacterium]|nr:hypothetical protein [Deltaproteobacteria bacterium]